MIGTGPRPSYELIVSAIPSQQVVEELSSSRWPQVDGASAIGGPYHAFYVGPYRVMAQLNVRDLKRARALAARIQNEVDGVGGIVSCEEAAHPQPQPRGSIIAIR